MSNLCELAAQAIDDSWGNDDNHCHIVEKSIYHLTMQYAQFGEVDDDYEYHYYLLIGSNDNGFILTNITFEIPLDGAKPLTEPFQGCLTVLTKGGDENGWSSQYFNVT